MNFKFSFFHSCQFSHLTTLCFVCQFEVSSVGLKISGKLPHEIFYSDFQMHTNTLTYVTYAHTYILVYL